MSAVDDFVGKALSRSEILGVIEGLDADVSFFFCAIPKDPFTQTAGLSIYMPGSSYYERLGVLTYLEDCITVSKNALLEDSPSGQDGECEHA